VREYKNEVVSLQATEVTVNRIGWMKEEAGKPDTRECARELHSNVPGFAHTGDYDTGVCIEGEERFDCVRETWVERLSDTGERIDLLSNETLPALHVGVHVGAGLSACFFRWSR